MNFGQEVKKRRKRAKLTQEELADRLSVVRSYVSQVETGAAQCREDFDKRIDTALGTRDEVQQKWQELIAPLLEQPTFPKHFANFPRAEDTAAHVRAYESYVVYGLVQIEDYARIVLNGDEDAIAARMHRQEVLTRNPPPLVCIILDESVLYRRVGTPEVMGSQLEHLIKVSEREKTFLQISPLDFQRDVRGSFTIATQVDRRELAYYPHPTGGETSADPRHLARLTDTFTRLQARAMNIEDSRTLIRKVREERWS